MHFTLQGFKMQHKKLMIALEEVIVELSYNCNLSCTMCGFGKQVNPFDKSKFLPLGKYKTILQQIGAITESIRLNGRGESTIHPGFVEMLNYTRATYSSIRINLFSNFSFRNEYILNALIENKVQLFISMDSPEEKELVKIRKGANYDFITSNIESIKGMPNRPFIVFTLQETNLHRILDIASFAFLNNCHILYNVVRRDAGINSFVELVRKNRGLIKRQFDRVSDLYKNSTLQCLFPDQVAGVELKTNNHTQTHGSMSMCPALQKELCILFDGTTTPCNMFNPYIYGNVFDQSLEEIWHGKARNDFLSSHKEHYYCKNCANLGV
jgi:MoaA/NifB/PqqE/SkfB family radical SAM enzyme